MSSYVNSILTGSEYFLMNLEHNTDDYIVRRMIKCCSNLGCFMQAAVLCQVMFLLYTFYKWFNDLHFFRIIYPFLLL